MEVKQPLIAKKNSTEPQILQVTAIMDPDLSHAKLRYASVSAAGKETVQHATCIVEYGDTSKWLSEWAQVAYLIKGRVASLQKSVETGNAQKITRGLAYKLFAASVQYNDTYRGMEEVILDSAEFEATARISFQTSEKEGSFFCSPYWIDSLAHISGFIMNGSDIVDSKNFVYISHGWKSMRFSKPFSRTTKYRSHVKMQPAGGNMVAGDVYIFEEDTVIGVVGGLKFQRIPRAILDSLLPPENAAGTKTKTAITKAQPAVAPRTKASTKPVQALNKIKNPLIAPPKAEKRMSSKSIAARALDIVAAEAEIDLSELQNECVFADLGVDSLLSLTIAGKFREDLDLDVPGSLFLDHPTVGTLKTFLSGMDHDLGSDEEEERHSRSLPSSPPDLGSSSSSIGDDEMMATPESADENLLSVIQSTIADQMGLALEEITGSVDLGTVGMDSLMTISILGSLREETGLSLPSSFFQDHPSMSDIEKFLNIQKSKPAKLQNLVVPHQLEAQTPPTTSSIYPPAVSILLQGNPKTATKTLFLFPDGSGSATSYAPIPDIAPDVCAFGLNCPFMTTPEAYTCGIERVSELYLTEVRRRQPHGPYYLGGWSAGGVIAYEVTQQLLRSGERVDRLILFDSPCPVRLEALPSRLHHFFNSIGLLGTGSKKGPPAWLLPHFESSIKSLTAYKAKPMDPAKAPKTLALWARDGVCKYPGDPRPPPSADDPKSMNWLLNNRTDFGYNGWDQILGAENIDTVDIAGNHFTMMRDPLVSSLSSPSELSWSLGLERHANFWGDFRFAS